MKPIEPWKPAKSGDIEHSKFYISRFIIILAHLMDMTSKKRKKGSGDDDEDEDEDNSRRKEVKKKSIFERENIFRKPYESNE